MTDTFVCKWLHDNGYIGTDTDGSLLVSAKALVLLGNLHGDEARTVLDAEPRGDITIFTPPLLRDIHRGVNTLEAKYGTDDMLTILFNEAALQIAKHLLADSGSGQEGRAVVNL